MWKLKQPTSGQLDKYKKKLLSPLKGSVNNTGNLLIKNTLLPMRQDGSEDESILIRLLTNSPKELYLLNNQLMNALIPNYDDTEFEDYIKAKAAKNKSPQQESLYKKYHDPLANLSEIFNYKKKISKQKPRSYMISQMKGRNSCTYCNRQYTQTIIRNGGTNDDNRIARPELDHWFSQKLFPLMSLSFFNLIPSCSICNSTAKGNSIFRFSTHIHPYLQTVSNPKFNFTYKIGINQKWEIDIENDTDLREKNMIDDFYLKEVYKFHSELELKDILDFSYGNNETYLETLFNQILKKFPMKTKEDVYRMLLGTEFHEDNFLDRPMSKFKYDILKKLRVINNFK